jgi:farnesyl diphosphate synthase
VTAPNFARAIAVVAAAVEAELLILLPSPEGPQAKLHEAMRYAVLGGGKRLRPFMVGATAELFGVRGAGPVRVGAAIELIHGYSLVHDDLPAMDDAELRRGRPSCHRAFGEATAILGGDALQSLAFEVLARRDYGVDAEQRSDLIAGLAVAAGSLGMCGGQLLDLMAEKRAWSLADISAMQRLKTGALIRYACEAGAILGRAPAEAATALGDYAAELGLAFQIQDDLLDCGGEGVATGKDTGRDDAVGKATFVGALGEAGAQRKLLELRGRALGRLDIFAGRATLLADLFDFVISRKS